MYHQFHSWQKAIILLVAFCGCALVTAPAYAQKKQALVILKSPGIEAATPCDGALELNYQMVFDLKLNNKDQVRLIDKIEPKPATLLSRKAYDDARKTKIRDVAALKWTQDGLLWAMPGGGKRAVLVLPDDRAPQKNSASALSSFYSVAVTGEVREGNQKSKFDIPLGNVWRIYQVSEGIAPNDALFQIATEEKHVPLWDAYLKKTSNYRGAEANGLLRATLLDCAKTEYDRFLKGNYAAYEGARPKAERADGINSDQTTKQLLAAMREMKEKVDTSRSQFEQLLQASKWDEAITVVKPIKVYFESWADMKNAYNRALKESHDLHRTQGEEALKTGQLEAALEHCFIAWERLPDSAVARGCVCTSRNEIALRDSQRLRQQSRPKDAKEVLEKQLTSADCGKDSRVVAELTRASCEYAQQIAVEAQQLISADGKPGPKPAKLKLMTAQNRQDFYTAREKLSQASKLCDQESLTGWFAALGLAVAEYDVGEARKAIKREAYATAYAYLRSAKEHAPNDPTVAELLPEIKNKLEEATHINVGVSFENPYAIQNMATFLQQIEAEVEGALSEAKLEKAKLLERRQAVSALQALQNNQPLPSLNVIFYGDLAQAEVRFERDPVRKSSTYSSENPAWGRANRIYEAAKAKADECWATDTSPPCESARKRAESALEQRDKLEQNLEKDYEYTETTITVTGTFKLSFRTIDSLSHTSQDNEAITATVSDECMARSGVKEGDKFQLENTPCTLPSKSEYLERMAKEVREQVRAQALAYLNNFSNAYYNRALKASSEEERIENYLRFLFVVKDKQGDKADRARESLIAFDEELRTDGVLK